MITKRKQRDSYTRMVVPQSSRGGYFEVAAAEAWLVKRGWESWS
jgi:hypothetical protein